MVITTFDALDLVDGIITNGLCLNLNGEPYLQIVFQNPNVWNLKQRSESGLTVHSSTDINGLGVSAATTTTNAASFFRIDATSNAVTFASATNCVYTVEGCTNLVAGGTLSSASADNGDGRAEEKRLVPPNWHTVTNLPGTGHRLSVPYTTNRFYRVKATLP